MSKQDIYRKVALDRLSSPEQLDQLMVLTRTRSWVALAGLGAILVTVLIWSIVGRVPFTVSGNGILVYPSGVLEVVSTTSGQVTEIMVTRNQTLALGDPIAKVSQPELESQLRDARRQITELQQQKTQTGDLAQRSQAISNELLDASDTFLRQKLTELEEQKNFFTERLDAQQQLVKQGLVTGSTVNDARESLFNVTSEIASTEQQLEQNRLQRVENRQQAESEKFDRNKQIGDLEAQASDLEKRLESASTITSNFAGEITELLFTVGDVIGQGTPLVNLDQETAGGLTAVVYIAPGDGKKVLPGMAIQIVPSTVKREEYGFVRGTVRDVSEFPSAPASMLAFLQDEALVSELSSDGPPIAVWVDLETDTSTPTGFAWSSGVGPPGTITTGTLAAGEVIVREAAPIELVIPTLRETFGL
ncbi:MAG: NHLP bacteriocin system secretion protein [Acidobacteriota bacterium]